jgi:hypothetical protein
MKVTTGKVPRIRLFVKVEHTADRIVVHSGRWLEVTLSPTRGSICTGCKFSACEKTNIIGVAKPSRFRVSLSERSQK